MMAAQDSDIAIPPASSKEPPKPEIIPQAVERHPETYQFTFQYANANTMLYLSNIFAMLLFACGLPMLRLAILDDDNSTQPLETSYRVNYGAGAVVVIFTVILVILALQIIVPLQSVCLDPTLVWKSICVVGITSFVAGCLGIRTTFSSYLGGLLLVLVLMHVLNLALHSRWTPLFFDVNARLSHPVRFRNGRNIVQILALYVFREYCYVIWTILAVRAWICLEVIYMHPTQCLNPDTIVTKTIPYFSWTAGWFVYLVYIIWLTTITYRGFVKMDEMENVAESSCYLNNVLKIVEFFGIESKTQDNQEDRLYRFMRMMRTITLPKTIATNETGELMTNDFVPVYWEKDETRAKQPPTKDTDSDLGASSASRVNSPIDIETEQNPMPEHVPEPKLQTTLNAAFRRDELEDALRHHWSLHLLEVIRPGKNPLELKHDKGHLWRLLLEPVEAFIAGEDQPAKKFATLKKEDPPTFLCNRSIPVGEPSYFCRDCSVSVVSALCTECFKQSVHKNHRYKEIDNSSGFGYCDCGNPELWKKGFACAQHKPPRNLKDVNFNLENARDRVPEDINKRFTGAIRHALCYVYQVLTFRDGVTIPPDLACPSSSEDPFPFVTILYNDKVDSYDDVIKTLTLALECTKKEALDYATLVDDEGRSPVKFGSEDECERVKKFVERDTKEQQPVRLEVVQMAAYAHQVFALEVLTWIQGLAEKCEGFRALICDVCLQVLPVGSDHLIVSTFLLEDVRLWKAARRGCYSLFMATFLTFNDAKIQFSRLLARLYTQLITAFIADNHDYYDSSTFNLIAKLFSVPTIARALFSDGLVEVIVESFVLFCQSRRNAQGILSFHRVTQPVTAAQFERALYTLLDVKKLLNIVPTSHQWTDALRKGFIGTFEQFLQIMMMMEGMDAHTRSTQSSVEYKTDWEAAFSMQSSMSGISNLLQQWCASDNRVLSVCTEQLLTAALTSFHAVVTSHAATSENIEKFVKTEKKKVNGSSFECIEYDVSAQIVSIHHPVIRMLAGLVVPALAKGIVLEVPGGRMPIEEYLKLHARELLELPLQTMVLLAQVRREMWCRNGDALYDQILYYQHPGFRGEMLDKDIVMMQACAAVMPPDSFLIALLDKFAVLPWADEKFDATFIHAEDDSILQVMCLAEEFLDGLIVLVGERFYPGVGRVTEEDCLKNEVIHQLCQENTSYRKLLKLSSYSHVLPNQEAKFSLDELIKEVAVLQEPSPTEDDSCESKSELTEDENDIYELKAKFTERYNMFFYHYDETERSEANDTQRKRRKQTWEEVVFAPPCPPPFSDAFSRVVHLLDCDVFIHLLKLTVQRALTNHPRFCFDDQLVRMLYLIGYALHEEKRQRLSNHNNNINHINHTNTNNNYDNNDNLKFLEKAAKAGVFMTLRKLRVRSHNETYKNLIEWVLHFYDNLTKQESMDTTEAPSVDSLGDAGNDDVRCKLIQKKTTLSTDEDSSDEDLMQLSSAGMLQQVMDVGGSSGTASMAIGVDFGAANVRVGRWIDEKFERIIDESGADAFPAFFGRKDGHDFFGEEAKKMSTVEPANVIFDVMQFAGLNYSQASDKIKSGIYPFKIRRKDDGRAFDFQLHNGSTVSPDEVIQFFLKHVHTQCKNLLGLQEFSLACTVPSYWYNPNKVVGAGSIRPDYWDTSIRKYRRTQLLDAARRSGFTQVSLIESQHATMSGCWISMKDSKTWSKDILIVDIGATDITATFTSTPPMAKTFTVTGTGLGCASVDQALMRYLLNQFAIKHRLSLKTTTDMTSWHRLRMECEKARICLSSAVTTVLFVPNFAVGYDLHVELTRDTFDDVVGSTIAEDVIDITEQVLALLKINVESSTKDDFRLFLVGGGSRIPCIRQRMDAEFGNKIDYVALQHCEDAAVYGAARYAQINALNPDAVKLDAVQHFRDLCGFSENDGMPWEEYRITGLANCRSARTHADAMMLDVVQRHRHLCDFSKNNGMPWEEYRITGLADCRSTCTHASARRTERIFDRTTSIIPSLHGISAKTDRVSYRFSIRDRIFGSIKGIESIIVSGLEIGFSIFFGSPLYSSAQLHHIKLTQKTAASLQLQQSHMVMLSFGRKISQLGKFEERVTTIRRPLDLRHPNVVQCLAVGRMGRTGELEALEEDLDYECKIHMLLDMRLSYDSLDDHLFPSSGLNITLHRFCKERGSSLGNKEIIDKTKQLLEGLSYLHNLKIPLILGNLTSCGILVTPDGETVKIWDILFGLVDRSPSQLDLNVLDYYTNDVLTYAHPDVLKYILEVGRDREKCSTLTFQPYMDIWSLGCVVLDMASGGSHFVLVGTNHEILLHFRITRSLDCFMMMSEVGGVPLIPKSAPDIIRRLCAICFERKPEHRTDALGLLAMISRISENEIDVCSRDEANLKQTTVSMFAASKNTFYEFNWVSILAKGGFGVVYEIEIPKINVAETSVYNNFPESAENEWRNIKKLALKVLENFELPESRHRLTRLSHDHVAKYISFGTVSKDPDNMAYKTPKSAILMEYSTGGNLNELAREQELSATEILDYAQQIASGLAYLHGGGRANLQSPPIKPIIHCDLKGDNIFLTSETPRIAKIGDIDSSLLLGMGKTMTPGAGIKGTLTHMSPEMLAFMLANKDEKKTDEDTDKEDTDEKDTEEDIVSRLIIVLNKMLVIANEYKEDTEEEYTGGENTDGRDNKSGSTKIGRATDIWSLGCIILEMFNGGDVPYANVDGSKLVIEPEKAKQFAKSVSLGAHPNISVADRKGIQPGFRQLLQECLQREPQKRPRASNLLSALTESQP